MSYHQLTQQERYTISRNKALCKSVRGPEVITGRSPSTVSRELRRNATTGDGVYRAGKANSYATARPRRCRRGPRFPEAAFQELDRDLRQRWSPQQIVGSWSRAGRRVPSHETIYRRIRRDKARGGFLFRYTRIMPKVGRRRYRSRPARGVLLGKRHISERPNCVNQRLRFGDWEGDTVMGKDTKHCLLTLIERKSGFVLIRKLPDRTARAVTRAVLDLIARPEHIFHTITFYNGTEFHDYRALEANRDLICYFATPNHSRERGTNENTNGLIRQYLPKGRCLANTTQAECDWIAGELNQRPRKRHLFQTLEAVCPWSDGGVALAS